MSSNVARTPSSRSSKKKVVRVRKTPLSSRKASIPRARAKQKEYSVIFDPGPIGLQLEAVTENPKYGCRVVRFVDGGPRQPGQARKSSKIKPGDLLIQVDGVDVVSSSYGDIIDMLKHTHSRRVITFKSVWDATMLDRQSNLDFSPQPAIKTASYMAGSISGVTKNSLAPNVPAIPQPKREGVITSTPSSQIKTSPIPLRSTPVLPPVYSSRNSSPMKQTSSPIWDSNSSATPGVTRTPSIEKSHSTQQNVDKHGVQQASIKSPTGRSSGPEAEKNVKSIGYTSSPLAQPPGSTKQTVGSTVTPTDTSVAHPCFSSRSQARSMTSSQKVEIPDRDDYPKDSKKEWQNNERLSKPNLKESGSDSATLRIVHENLATSPSATTPRSSSTSKGQDISPFSPSQVKRLSIAYKEPKEP